MRKVLLGLVFAFGFVALGGCDSGSKKPNDPPPPPQDSGADKNNKEPKPVAPKKE